MRNALIEKYLDRADWRIGPDGELYDAAKLSKVKDESDEFEDDTDEVTGSERYKDNRDGRSITGRYVPENLVKYSDREEPPKGVGERPRGDAALMAREEAEKNKRLQQEAAEKEKHKLKPPTKAMWEKLADEAIERQRNAALKAKAESAKVEEKPKAEEQKEPPINALLRQVGVADEVIGGNNGREVNAGAGPDTKAEEVGEVKNDRRRAEGTGRDIGKGSRESDTSGGLRLVESKPEVLPKNREGVLVEGKEEDGVSFGKGVHELTKLNKRDAAIKSFVEKLTGLKCRLFDGEIRLNGKKVGGIHRGGKGEILIDVSTPKGVETAVHEIIHAKFKAAAKDGYRRSESVKAYDALAAIAKKNGKEGTLNELFSRAKAHYYDAYISNAVDEYKAVGKSDKWIEEHMPDIEKAVLDHIKEEVITPIATGHTDSPSSKLFAELRDDARKILIEQGVVDNDFFDRIPYTKKPKAANEQVLDELVAEQSPVSKTEEEDDLPFTMNEEEIPRSSAEYASTEHTKATKPEINRANLGPKLESIQKNADRVDRLEAFSNDDRYGAAVGTGSRDRVNQSIGEYKKAVRDFAHGHRDIVELKEYFDSIKGNEDLKLFRSDRIDYALGRAVEDYKLAFAENGGTRFDANRFRHSAENAMKLISRQAELGNEAMRNLAEFQEAAKKSGGKRKKIPVADWLASQQVSAPTLFRWVDGFDAEAKGIGYATAKAIEDSVAVANMERLNGNSFFQEIAGDESMGDFLRGKTKSGVKLDGVELSELDAISLLMQFRTMAATSKSKMDGLKGIYIKAGGKETWFEFGDGKDGEDRRKDLIEELQGSLSSSAERYMDAMENMFLHYSRGLKETSEDIYGVGMKLFEKGKYYPLRFTAKDAKLNDYSLAESLESIVDDGDIETPGITHARKGKSGDYLVAEPVTEVVNRYINQASNYIAYGGVVRRMELMNTGGSGIPSMSEILNEDFGPSFKRWMNNYLDDMSLTGKKSDGDGGFLSVVNPTLKKLRKNLQQGVLLFSPSTPLKQGSAYFSAMGVLKPSSLVSAWNWDPKFWENRGESKGNYMAEGRKLGGYDPTLNELLHESDTWLGKLKSKDNALGRAVKAAADSIAARDAKIVDDLWHATVIDVARSHPDMKQDSAAFKKLVEQKFEEVMLVTQSTSEVAIGSEAQRTENQLIRSAYMFRSQQTQDFNEAIRAIGEARAAKGTPGEAAAKKKAISTVEGTLASSLHYAVLTAVVNGVLHKLKRYRDDEGEVAAEKIVADIGMNAIETFAGTVWGGDFVVQAAADMVMKAMGKDSNEFYGISLGPISTIVDIAESVEWFLENKTLANAKRVAGHIANLAGFPLNNVYNVLNAATMFALDAAGENPEHYDDILKFLGDKSKAKRKEKSLDSARYYGLHPVVEEELRRLYGSTNNNSMMLPERSAGDEFSYDGYEYKITKEEASSMASKQSKTYSDFLDEIISAAYYKKASDGDKAKMVNAAKEYAVDAAKESLVEGRGANYSSSYTEAIDDFGERTGIKYLSLKSAYSVAEKKDNYDLIDWILAESRKLPSDAKDSFKADVGKSLYEASESGVKSKTYDAVKEKKSAGYSGLDALYEVMMTTKERDALAKTNLNSSEELVYNAVSGTKYASEAPDIFDLVTGGDGQIAQKDLVAAYKTNPDLDSILEHLWEAKGASKSWDKEKKK
jgi:hypothetical protein